MVVSECLLLITNRQVMTANTNVRIYFNMLYDYERVVKFLLICVFVCVCI